jgi:hypothetical protein
MTVSRQSINRISWSDFIRFAEPHGVQLKETLEPVGDTGKRGAYLVRVIAGEQLRLGLPEDFREDKPMGMWEFESARRRLRLEPDFTGWPYVL